MLLHLEQSPIPCQTTTSPQRQDPKSIVSLALLELDRPRRSLRLTCLCPGWPWNPAKRRAFQSRLRPIQTAMLCENHLLPLLCCRSSKDTAPAKRCAFARVANNVSADCCYFFSSLLFLTYLISKLQFTRMMGKTPKVRRNSLEIPSGVGNDFIVSEHTTTHCE